MAQQVIRIAPSMMCADFLHLGRELEAMATGGVDFLHLDIMDGHYVPNYTLGPDFCWRLVAASPIPLDIHLMIERVDEHAPLFASIPGATVSFPPEATWHPLRAIESIRACGARPGIAIDPAMPLAAVEELLPHVSLACIMTVNPGYAGQPLIPSSLPKIRQLADLAAARGWQLDIEVDGNVSWENIPRMIELGATVLVAGSSSLYDGGELEANLRRLKALLPGRT